MNRRAFVFGSLLLACSTKKKEGEQKAVAVTDDSIGVLFIWIDEKGDAHTETKAGAVPEASRALVRVIVPEQEEGSADAISVVDLRTKQADGTYAIRRVPKREFEALAESRRSAHGPTLGTAEQEAGVARPEHNQKIPTAPPKVIIYGASWCKPCHQAADYLKSIGVPFVLYDIEKEPARASEMAQKLEASNHRGGSIPVLDIGGAILIGYSQVAVDKALVSAGY